MATSSVDVDCSVADTTAVRAATFGTPDAALASSVAPVPSLDDTIDMNPIVGWNEAYKSLCHAQGRVTAMCMVSRFVLATGTENGSIVMFDVRSATHVRSIVRAHVKQITCMCMVAPGMLVTGSTDCSLSMWDVDTGVSLWVCRQGDAIDDICAVAPYVVACGLTGVAKVICIPRYAHIHATNRVVRFFGYVKSLCVVAEGIVAVCTGRDSIMIWDTRGRGAVSTFSVLMDADDWITSVCMTSRSVLAVGTYHGNVKLYDTKDLLGFWNSPTAPYVQAPPLFDTRHASPPVPCGQFRPHVGFGTQVTSRSLCMMSPGLLLTAHDHGFHICSTRTKTDFARSSLDLGLGFIMEACMVAPGIVALAGCRTLMLCKIDKIISPGFRVAARGSLQEDDYVLVPSSRSFPLPRQVTCAEPTLAVAASAAIAPSRVRCVASPPPCADAEHGAGAPAAASACEPCDTLGDAPHRAPPHDVALDDCASDDERATSSSRRGVQRIDVIDVDEYDLAPLVLNAVRHGDVERATQLSACADTTSLCDAELAFMALCKLKRNQNVHAMRLCSSLSANVARVEGVVQLLDEIIKLRNFPLLAVLMSKGVHPSFEHLAAAANANRGDEFRFVFENSVQDDVTNKALLGWAIDHKQHATLRMLHENGYLRFASQSRPDAANEHGSDMV